jgi:hypothetical protein
VVSVVVGELQEVVLGGLNDQTVSTARCHTQPQEEPHSREAVNATLDESMLQRAWRLLGIGMLRLRTSARPDLSISSRHTALASESPLRLPAPAFCFEDANLKQPERMGSYVAGRGLARAREFAHPQSRCPRLEVACPASNSSCEAAHQHTATRCMSMRTNTHTLTVACASAQAQTGTRVRARFPMLQLTCVTRVVVAKHY